MIYAIGDIHGQKAMLDQALALIEADGGTDAHIVFLGDYTDRGPDSRGVLETLISGCEQGRNWSLIKGNHDQMFCKFVTQAIEIDPRVKSSVTWLNKRLGGTETLASYGLIGDPTFQASQGRWEMLDYFTLGDQRLSAAQLAQKARDVIPQKHLSFLASLPVSYQTDDLLFVHAGIKPGIPLEQQDPQDILWIRDHWLDDQRDHGKLIVHGHTALDAPQHAGNRVNLDGGAGYGRPLVPAVFEGRNCWLLTDDGRVPLRP